MSVTGTPGLSDFAQTLPDTQGDFRAWRNMGETFFNLSRIAWLVGIALLVMIANVAASVLYMVVYGYLIDPGHDQQYYDAHIQIAAPYCSIVAGIPLMFLAGWRVGRWWQGQFAIKSAVVILAYLRRYRHRNNHGSRSDLADRDAGRRFAHDKVDRSLPRCSFRKSLAESVNLLNPLILDTR